MNPNKSAVVPNDSDWLKVFRKLRDEWQAAVSADDVETASALWEKRTEMLREIGLAK